MTRPLRIPISDGIYHVTARGNGRQTIYLDDHDRGLFFSVFDEVIRRFGWRCLTYCLMNSHYHLVIRTPRPNLSEGMRQLNGVYARRFNRRHDTCGHLFQRRFHCTLVGTDNYLLELARYVALNPVRAGICTEPGDWPWSAHRVLLGIANDKLVSAGELLAHFGSSLPSARENYRLFVQRSNTSWIPNERTPVAGNTAFVEATLPNRPPSREFAGEPWRQSQPPLYTIFDCHPHCEAIYVAYTQYGYRLREIAEFLDCHYSTVSRRLRKFEGGRELPQP